MARFIISPARPQLQLEGKSTWLDCPDTHFLYAGLAQLGNRTTVGLTAFSRSPPARN